MNDTNKFDIDTIDLDDDTMRIVFTKMKEAIDYLQNNPNSFYEGNTLPLVSVRNRGMLYFKVKNSEAISFPIGLTLQDGTVTKTDPLYEVRIDS